MPNNNSMVKLRRKILDQKTVILRQTREFTNSFHWLHIKEAYRPKLTYYKRKQLRVSHQLFKHSAMWTWFCPKRLHYNQ